MCTTAGLERSQRQVGSCCSLSIRLRVWHCCVRQTGKMFARVVEGGANKFPKKNMNYEAILTATRLNILWRELIEVNVDTPWFKSVTNDHFHLALHDKLLSQMTASLSYAQLLRRRETNTIFTSGIVLQPVHLPSFEIGCTRETTFHSGDICPARFQH